MPEYDELATTLRTHLAPEGPLEELCVEEIVNAATRLRRCTVAEASLHATAREPMLDPNTAAQQSAVDRARAQAHRLFQRSIADLRRLQTDRLVRDTVAAEANVQELPIAGLPDYRELVSIMSGATRLKMSGRRLHDVETIEKVIHNCVPKPESETVSDHIPTPRNAQCPCGSGEKYKRCCGKSAPPILFPGVPAPSAAAGSR